MTEAAKKPSPPAGPAPKRVVPPIATVLVCSDKANGKSKPTLPGLVVLFRTATMSPIPEKARAKPSDKSAAEAAPEPPPAPPPAFSAGMVDRKGYLVPWEKLREQRSQRKAITTDSIKFVAPPAEETLYDFFLVSHPDPKRIEAILKNVNDHGGVFKEGDTEIKPVRLKLQRAGGKGQEHVLEVPEDPAKILPLEGSTEHGGWLLYRDMPHQGCAAVSEQIEKLQKSLGAMRYPIGSGDDPYVPEAKSNQGIFDVRTWNGVLAFQRVFLGKPKPADGEDEPPAAGFVKTDSVKKLAGAGSAKDFADIALAEKTGSAVMPAADWPRPKRADGVVDDATAKAIKHCIDKDLRKPGHTLVPFLHEMDASNVRWLRAEAVSALATWRDLAKTFGWTNGIHAFHTYRSALADITSADYGRATLSIHKSGYAIDLQMSGYIVPWTSELFYEKVILGSRVRWRLWGRIAADKGRLGAGFDAVAQILADRHARTRAQLQEAAAKAEAANAASKDKKVKVPAVPAALDAAAIAAMYRECLDEEVIGGPVFRQAAQKVSKALALDQGDVYDRFLEQDVEHLLDDEVDAFEYKRDHKSFACDAKDFFVTKTAKKGEVFLCLTALARLARLTGISAFPDGWHSTRKLVTLPTAVTLPQGSAEAFGGVASAIGMANKRYDEDLVRDRGVALVDHVLHAVASVQESKLGQRPKKGVFTPNPDPAALVADVPASAFGRQLKPLFGSELDSAAVKELRNKLEELLLALAKAAVEKRVEMLAAGTNPKSKDIGEALKKLGEERRPAIDAAISDFETQQPLDSGKLWHVRIKRGDKTAEVPLKDLDDAVVKSIAAWKQECAKRKWVATPSLVFTDVKVKVEPGIKVKADPKTRTVTVDAAQPRMKALSELHKAVGDVTLELKSVYFVPDAATKDGAAKGGKEDGKDKKKGAPAPVAGQVVAEVKVGPSDDIVEATKKVLEEAYRLDTAVEYVPALVVTPRFSDTLDMREGDTVEITYPGEPIGMEWWHHQYHPALQGEEEDAPEGAAASGGPKKWSTLLTEIGWELDVMGDGPGEAAYGYPGVGYSAKDLQKKAS
jgi:hypothetical protein